jgi:alpha-beta hydrolase superfamily lysophospholipase
LRPRPSASGRRPGWTASVGAPPPGLTLPLLLLQGEADKLIDVPKTRRWFARLGVQDKTYRAYPGAGHTLDFEPDRTRYLADLLGWLSTRAASGSSPPTSGGP